MRDIPSLGEPEGISLRAAAIAGAGNLESALLNGSIPPQPTLSMAEALVIGFLQQGVRKYFAIFGHGSTALAEVLRIYEETGLTRTFQFRNEVAMAHAATALSWVYGEVPAVVTSIGPGALQAMAGSLAAASNGVGVYHIYGDETTHGEGYNMQQIPKPVQGGFGMLANIMGRSYTLHTPEAMRDALRRGRDTVFHPSKPGPFYLMLPINTQPQPVKLSLASLPGIDRSRPGGFAGEPELAEARERISRAERIVIKAGGGSRAFAGQIRELAERIGAVVVLSPGSTGVLPDSHPQNMHVGGSKGSISGNFAMEEADLLIAAGTRAVCQSDCSGIGYPRVRHVLNINADYEDAHHYNRTLALVGDMGTVIAALLQDSNSGLPEISKAKQEWLRCCGEKKAEWSAFKTRQFEAPRPLDPVWGRRVLTQPQAIKVAADFAREKGAIKYFDAGDVQANGFQIVEDDDPFSTYTEAGASYMGFAASALVSGALADKPRYAVAFSGDGSFFMNPQILVDGVEHGLRATLVIFDNRRMSAISALQLAQYGEEFRTNDGVAVDYVKLASSVKGVLALDGGDDAESLRTALDAAHAYSGLSVIHVPVYFGPDEAGGMGAYGRWNVGNWCEDVQRQYREQII